MSDYDENFQSAEYCAAEAMRVMSEVERDWGASNHAPLVQALGALTEATLAVAHATLAAAARGDSR